MIKHRFWGSQLLAAWLYLFPSWLWKKVCLSINLSAVVFPEVVELWSAPFLLVMIQLNCKICCVEEESVREASLSILKTFSFPVLATHIMNFCLLIWEGDSQVLHLQLSARLECLWYFGGPENVPWFTVEQKHSCALLPPLLGDWEFSVHWLYSSSYILPPFRKFAVLRNFIRIQI